MLRTDRKIFMDRQLTIRPLGLHHNEWNRVNEGLIPIASEPFPSYLFIPSRHAPRTLFPIVSLSPQTKLIFHHALALYLITVSELPPELDIVNPKRVCQMS
jgi:hypothetical protein